MQVNNNWSGSIMKRFVISSLVAGVVAMGLSVNAQDAAPAVPAAPVEQAVKKQKVPPPPAVDLTVSGTLKKDEQTKMNKAGKEVKKVQFSLVQDDGSSVKLPTPRAKKGEAAAINLDAFVDKKVKVVGKGNEGVDKKGAKKTVVSEITTIEEVAAAPVAK
jgi:hypothetical protein